MSFFRKQRLKGDYIDIIMKKEVTDNGRRK